LTGVAIIGQCSDRNISDVFSIDERFAHRTDRKSHFAGDQGVQEEVLTEVLREEAAAQDCPVRATGFQCPLGLFSLRFPSA